MTSKHRAGAVAVPPPSEMMVDSAVSILELAVPLAILRRLQGDGIEQLAQLHALGPSGLQSMKGWGEIKVAIVFKALVDYQHEQTHTTARK